jgi:hypothetical protein
LKIFEGTHLSYKLSESFGRGDKFGIYKRVAGRCNASCFYNYSPKNESITTDVGSVFSLAGFLNFYGSGIVAEA